MKRRIGLTLLFACLLAALIARVEAQQARQGAGAAQVKAGAIGAHPYFCAIHDWMTGTITVGS